MQQGNTVQEHKIVLRSQPPNLPIHPSFLVCPFIHPSIHPPIHPSIHPSVHASIHPSLSPCHLASSGKHTEIKLRGLVLKFHPFSLTFTPSFEKYIWLSPTLIHDHVFRYLMTSGMIHQHWVWPFSLAVSKKKNWRICNVVIKIILAVLFVSG